MTEKQIEHIDSERKSKGQRENGSCTQNQSQNNTETDTTRDRKKKKKPDRQGLREENSERANERV